MISASEPTSRFDGPGGEGKKIAALLGQELIANNSKLAKSVSTKGALFPYKEGDLIITQGGTDDDVYFILLGEVHIFVNGHHVATRCAGESVGEMAAIDSGAPRSATVKAASSHVLLYQLKAHDFVALCNKYSALALEVAKLASHRLRERSKYHLPANDKPILFIGSSKESLDIVEAVESQLPSDALAVRPWTTDGVFPPSGYPVDDLLAEVNQADFALFVFGPDDKVASRGKVEDGVRDNVIFEMGLFIGRISRRRVFMVREKGPNLRIPSDLFGLNPLTFDRPNVSTLKEAVGPACDRLLQVIAQRGVVRDRMLYNDSTI